MVGDKKSRKEYLKAWRLSKKEHLKALNAALYLKHKEGVLARCIKYKQDNLENTLLQSSRKGAKRDGREHTITLEDIVIPEYCPYLGIKLTNIQGQGLQDFNPSVDRIDSSKDYVRGNIQIISYLANKMKQNATKEQLIAFAEGVFKLHGRTINN